MELDGVARTALRVWIMIGIAVLAVGAYLLLQRLSVVVVPLVLALFPAALLAPLVAGLTARRVPRPLAVGLVLLVAAGVVAGVVALIVPAFINQVPALTQSLNDAAARLEGLLRGLPFVADTTTLSDVARKAASSLGASIDTVVQTGVDLLAGLALLLVVLAIYLTGGPRIVTTATSVAPARLRVDARELLARLWSTLAAFTRGLFLIALVDSVAVGLGLMLLDVPLVLPLAVLIFFGAFIPYVGALVSGLLAVLVGFASGGVGSALAVLALLIVVQQLEGNLVYPLLMGRAVRISAFTVVTSVGVGATLLGVLGAFLAVPAAACASRAVWFLRERAERPTAATSRSQLLTPREDDRGGVRPPASQARPAAVAGTRGGETCTRG